jgi:formylglycine-generating enzyme required for sulfatase activity
MKRAFHDRRGRRMLLVIGDPGAGKTTLLKYYALCTLEDSARLGFSDSVKVFYLPLRELSSHEGHYETLPAHLAGWSVMQHHAIKKECFDDWLHSGSSLVLLDGLDEISNTQERIEVCRWIDAALNTFPAARFVVTSRATGYRKEEGIELEADYERADVQDFTTDQQERFLRNWFRAAFLKEPCEQGFEEAEWQEKQQKEAEKRTVTLVEHLNAEKNKGVRQLAAIPMILQIMAILWKDRDYLPESRVKLYEASLDYLLEFRDKRRGIVPLLSAQRARQVLAPVALWMQEKLKKDEARRVEMHKKMKERLDKQDKPPSVDDFCDYLVKRAGLLVETGAHDYLFRHKSFREYLAGVQLVTKVRSTRYLGNLIAGFGNDWWDEPIRFFIAQGDEEIFNLFMKKLFDSPLSEELSDKQQRLLQTLIEEAPLKKVDALCTKLLAPTNTANRQRVILDCLKAIGKPAALNALEEFKTKALAINKDVADRADEVIYALQELKDKAEPITITLPVINLEHRPASFRNQYEHNAEYILIKKGSYLDPETKKKKDAEKDLYFAKYPVTNKLYRSFIAALGESLKLQEELDKIANNNTWDSNFANHLKEGKNDLVALFRSTYDEDRKFGGDDQPVVGITWYAAQAYSLWLSQRAGKLDSYRLPSELEWQWAAGGKRGKDDVEVVQEVREYPWPKEKGEPNSKLLNYDGNVGATTPVGSYPEGATPEGLYDMAGNVWEWTEEWHQDYRSSRVIRGGGWDFSAEYCRSAFRALLLPRHPDQRRWLPPGLPPVVSWQLISGFVFEREGSANILVSGDEGRITSRQNVPVTTDYRIDHRRWSADGSQKPAEESLQNRGRHPGTK